jgi:hypothetical protein
MTPPQRLRRSPRGAPPVGLPSRSHGVCSMTPRSFVEAARFGSTEN